MNKENNMAWVAVDKSGQAGHGRKCEFYSGFDEIVLYADTEPEAIFKAGEWILNQQDKRV